MNHAFSGGVTGTCGCGISGYSIQASPHPTTCERADAVWPATARQGWLQADEWMGLKSQH